jgi:hypothetical protein
MKGKVIQFPKSREIEMQELMERKNRKAAELAEEFYNYDFDSKTSSLFFSLMSVVLAGRDLNSFISEDSETQKAGTLLK